MEVQGHPWLLEKAEALPVQVGHVPSSEATQQNEQRPMLGSPAELCGPFSPFSKPGKDPGPRGVLYAYSLGFPGTLLLKEPDMP